MIAAIIFVVCLCVLFALIGGIIRPRRGNIHDFGYSKTRQSEIDIDVLTLLLSRAENEYLRRSLNVEEFRRIRRERVALARAYLKAINTSTEQFIRAAEAARSWSDPELARAIDELLSIAFRIRMNVPIVELCLVWEWIFPSFSLTAGSKIKAYREMMKRISFIAQRLQLPGSAAEPV